MPVKKTTIVAADDDPQLLRLVTRNLEFEGYEVLPTSNGQQALEQVEAHAPDLVLLDVMMPKMDGFTVCQRVREFSLVPIIIVTARGQDQDKVRGLDLGADDYLTKPFSVDELLARVRAVLRRAQFAANEHAHVLQTSIGDLVVGLYTAPGYHGRSRGSADPHRVSPPRLPGAKCRSCRDPGFVARTRLGLRIPRGEPHAAGQHQPLAPQNRN